MIEPSVSQALVGVFVMGIMVGFAGGVSFSELQGESDELVTLNNPDYPYGDVPAGVGQENIQRGNTTYEVKGYPYIGSEDAEVTAVAYEEFQCPFCERYNSRSFPQLLRNDIKTGEVRYYMKDFMIGHPWALKAHNSAHCALEQDAEAYWTFKEGFYSNQDALNSIYEENETKFDLSVKKWAEQTDLDTEQFNQCYDNMKYREKIATSQEKGRERGVSGTPTIFIEDQKVVGAQPYPRFEEAVNSELEE